MDFKDIDLAQIAIRISQYPTDNKPEFLVQGRSNAGKSSFTIEKIMRELVVNQERLRL